MSEDGGWWMDGWMDSKVFVLLVYRGKRNQTSYESMVLIVRRGCHMTTVTTYIDIFAFVFLFKLFFLSLGILNYDLVDVIREFREMWRRWGIDVEFNLY